MELSAQGKPGEDYNDFLNTHYGAEKQPCAKEQRNWYKMITDWQLRKDSEPAEGASTVTVYSGEQ